MRKHFTNFFGHVCSNALDCSAAAPPHQHAAPAPTYKVMEIAVFIGRHLFVMDDWHCSTDMFFKTKSVLVLVDTQCPRPFCPLSLAPTRHLTVPQLKKLFTKILRNTLAVVAQMNSGHILSSLINPIKFGWEVDTSSFPFIGWKETAVSTADSDLTQ